MPLWKIALRSLTQRSLASSLTAFSMALGVALVVAVLVIHSLVSKSFMTGSGLGYNVIVGANKGGKLQLVLNTVYYLSSPVENIPYSFYKEFTHGKYKDYVQLAVPVCLGDYYEDYRVVGTTPAFFNDLTYNSGQKFEFAAGRNFKQREFFCAVIGSTVARELGMTVGSEFTPTHGVPGDEEDHLHDPFRVVGVLAPTGTPNDRALFINMEGFYLTGDHAKPEAEGASGMAEKAADKSNENGDEMSSGEAADESHDHAEEGYAEEGHDHAEEAPAEEAHSEDAHADDHAHADGHNHAHGHDHHHHHSHDPIPESQREVTAVLLLTGMPGLPPELIAQDLVPKINEGVEGQAVLPIKEIQSLFQIFVEPVRWLLLGLTILIVVVAGISILVSIYNSMSERQREIAVMRALGAGRGTVMTIVLLESILLALGGGLLGWMLGHLLIYSLNPWLQAHAGVSIGLFQFVPLELVIIPGLILLATIVGYLPALVAYRTDVSKALSATP